jgi:hypothetical protein
MKVISFKVEDRTYNALKKIIDTKKQSFRNIFEPLAIEIAKNNNIRTKYTGVYHKISNQTYIELHNIKKTLEKILKTYDSTKKRKDDNV